MCERKPGPRCSNHARSELSRAQAAYEADPTPQNRAAAHGAQAAYDSTPAGQTALQGVIASHQGSLASANAAYANDPTMENRVARDTTKMTLQRYQGRLSEAAATREQQVTDLRIAKDREARYTARTPEEDAYVQHTARRLTAAQGDLERSQARLGELGEQLQQTPSEYTDPRTCELKRQWASERENVRTAQHQVVSEAGRLYQAHGARYGHLYASDMAAVADKDAPSTLASSIDDTGPAHEKRAPAPLKFKVKTSGPDKAATEAAREASKTDPGYQAAVKTERDALGALSTTRAALDERRTEVRQHLPVRDELNRAHLREQANHDQLSRVVAAESGTVSKTKARVAAGAGTTAEEIPWGEANDRVYRNPDGTTNAYVYREPSDGFPDGVYVRATGVASLLDSGGHTNTLLLEDGRIGHNATSYSRPQGYRSTGPSKILVTPPARGATPLWEETGSRSWGTFVDSTD